MFDEMTIELKSIRKIKNIATINIKPFTKTLSAKEVDFVSISLFSGSLFGMNSFILSIAFFLYIGKFYHNSI